MAAKKKYYAVKKGKKPGIYTQWFGTAGAEVQVRGFTGLPEAPSRSATFNPFAGLADMLAQDKDDEQSD